MNESNSGQVGHEEKIGDLSNVNEPNVYDPYLMGGIGLICLPQVKGNDVFHMVSTMLQLFQLKGFFSGFANDDSHEYIIKLFNV